MSKTHEQFKIELYEKNENIMIIGKYSKVQERIEVKCLECGYIWNPKACSLLQGRGCPKCRTRHGVENNKGKTKLKTIEKFKEEMKLISPAISIIGEYKNGHTYIKCKCNICENIWEAKPYSLLRGHGCPRCAKSGTSFMEQFIRFSFVEILGTEKVYSRDKNAIGMELDIYIPSMNLAIEPGNWYLHKRYIKKDQLKREKCNEKGIKLITIYDKFPLDEKIPFNDNIFTYEKDLNSENHEELKNLIYKLLKISDLNYNYTKHQWEKIEKEAYKNSKAMTHKDFIERMFDIHPEIEVIGRYVNSSKRLLVKCKKCGYKWNGVPANMLSGDGCRRCGTKVAHQSFIKSQEEFEKQVCLANSDIEIIGIYTGRHQPVKAKCRICGYEWTPLASSLLRGSNHKGWKNKHKLMNKLG